jgi:hypothetical protein
MISTKPSKDTLAKLVTTNPAGFKAGIFKGKKDHMNVKFKKKVPFIGERKLKPNS